MDLPLDFITPLTIDHKLSRPHGSSQSLKVFPKMNKNYIQSKIEKDKYRKTATKNMDIMI